MDVTVLDYNDGGVYFYKLNDNIGEEELEEFLASKHDISGIEWMVARFFRRESIEINKKVGL